MKKGKKSIYLLLAGGVLFSSLAITSCKKKEKDPELPKIGGYNNSNEVAATNLKAHWTFDDTKNEVISNTAPTSSANDTYVTGVKGKAISLNKGYLYYASSLGALTTNGSFTISAWIQVTNNQGVGGGPQSYFQSAIPGKLFGNVTAMAETGQFKASSDTLSIKGIYQDKNGGTQDNINNYGVVGVDYQVVKGAGNSKWVHVITAFDGSNPAKNIIQLYANNVKVGNKNFEDRGANTFKFTTPSEVIIGGWYNNIPGKTVSSDDWTIPFTGKIDEIRVYDKLLTDAEMKALFDLETAGR